MLREKAGRERSGGAQEGELGHQARFSNRLCRGHQLGDAFVAVLLTDEEDQRGGRSADAGTETIRVGGERGIGGAEDHVEPILRHAQPLELLRLDLRQREHRVGGPVDVEPAFVSIAAPPWMVVRGQYEWNAPAPRDRERGLGEELPADPVVVDELVLLMHRQLHVRHHLRGDSLGGRGRVQVVRHNPGQHPHSRAGAPADGGDARRRLREALAAEPQRGPEQPVASVLEPQRQHVGVEVGQAFPQLEHVRLRASGRRGIGGRGQEDPALQVSSSYLRMPRRCRARAQTNHGLLTR